MPITTIPMSEEMYEANEIRKWAKSEVVRHLASLEDVITELEVLDPDTYSEIIEEARIAISSVRKVPGMIDSAFWSHNQRMSLMQGS